MIHMADLSRRLFIDRIAKSLPGPSVLPRHAFATVAARPAHSPAPRPVSGAKNTHEQVAVRLLCADHYPDHDRGGGRE